MNDPEPGPPPPAFLGMRQIQTEVTVIRAEGRRLLERMEGRRESWFWRNWWWIAICLYSMNLAMVWDRLFLRTIWLLTILITLGSELATRRKRWHLARARENLQHMEEMLAVAQRAVDEFARHRSEPEEHAGDNNSTIYRHGL